MATLRLIIVLLIFILTGCGIGAGTLGGFDTKEFSTSKQNLVRAIDTLFARHPEYIIPSKWKSRNDWKERGYDFLDSRIFYFKSEPEEMYYVTFYGDANDSIQVDTTKTGLSIRATDNGISGWTLEEATSSKDKKRIEKRFEEEIILKLEEYIKLESIIEK
jgi:hypothetical protein